MASGSLWPRPRRDTAAWAKDSLRLGTQQAEQATAQREIQAQRPVARAVPGTVREPAKGGPGPGSGAGLLQLRHCPQPKADCSVQRTPRPQVPRDQQPTQGAQVPGGPLGGWGWEGPQGGPTHRPLRQLLLPLVKLHSKKATDPCEIAVGIGGQAQAHSWSRQGGA